MTHQSDTAAARPQTPQGWRPWALDAAHLLELTEEFFRQADEGVHMALADFCAARGEHPVTAPDGYLDALGLTAFAVRSDATAGETA
ncbi:hypothetical protein ACIG5E_36525 [Kitasatospora sp. NPDC053057]|uniref:hypothetical protein n=1 Tax=Kitasatospora sp. NPDC053057 TaxID=3364062 RepID=UPI0037C7D5BD